jgi:hypothetical protein
MLVFVKKKEKNFWAFGQKSAHFELKSAHKTLKWAF